MKRTLRDYAIADHVDALAAMAESRHLTASNQAGACGSVTEGEVPIRRCARRSAERLAHLDLAARHVVLQSPCDLRVEKRLLIVPEELRDPCAGQRPWPRGRDPARHRKHQNNRIEEDHSILTHRLRPMRCLQGLSSTKVTLKRIETVRATRRAGFEACEQGVLNETQSVRELFDDERTAA